MADTPGQQRPVNDGATWYVTLGCGHIPRVWTAGAADLPGSGDGRFWWCFTCRETVRVVSLEMVVEVGK